MNRANARVHLDISDVERALGVSAEFRIPSDIAIPQSVNRGVPVVLDKPRSPAALALRALADRYSTPDPGPAVGRARGVSRAASPRLAPIANRRSHTMSQQYSRWQDLQTAARASTRTAQLEELRLRVHQFVIDQVGPKLSDDERRARPSCGASCRSRCTRR